jgi:hypothetical protein
MPFGELRIEITSETITDGHAVRFLGQEMGPTQSSTIKRYHRITQETTETNKFIPKEGFETSILGSDRYIVVCALNRAATGAELKLFILRVWN